MKNNILLRVVKLGKLPPVLNNVFPVLSRRRFKQAVGRGLSGQVVDKHGVSQRFFVIENCGVYLPSEVEVVTEEQLLLENTLFTFLMVFPNASPSQVLNTNASYLDVATTNTFVPRLRRLLKHNGMQRYHNKNTIGRDK
jgi:hypothetical protein